MFARTHLRIISGFVGVTLLIGLISLLVSAGVVRRTVYAEATTRISQDLNAAWEIYDSRRASILMALTLAASEEELSGALFSADDERLSSRLSEVASIAELDFSGIVTIGDRREDDRMSPVARLALDRREPLSGTMVLSGEELSAESPALALRAVVRTATDAPEAASGLCIVAAAPVFSDYRMIGVIYGGVLLNRSTHIVDRVRETVFRAESYAGRSIGTATVFLGDVRVATNVRNEAGEREVGTTVSPEVRPIVLDEGLRWVGRAYVVRDWFITAYDPVIDLEGERVGMLCVGVLEDKYADMQRRTILVLVAAVAGGCVLALAFGYLLSVRIVRPIARLTDVAQEVSRGNLDPGFGPDDSGELGVLQSSMRDMICSIKDRDSRLQTASEIKLLETERQASIGRLAAGVAHEINNPLTGVLTFTHMLLRRTDLDESVISDLTTIARATDRVREIVKGLLDFSRQTEIEPVDTEVNDFIREILPLVENQALVKGIRFCFDAGADLPRRRIDRTQMQSVVVNIILNAIDATDVGGHVTITTSVTAAPRAVAGRSIEISIEDTGCGIPPEYLSRLFDPFFTTKETGKGTGLGLSVSLGIVERHGGTITVKSRVGVGSLFTVSLPVEEEA